jgi:hypothetical protein
LESGLDAVLVAHGRLLYRQPDAHSHSASHSNANSYTGANSYTDAIANANTAAGRDA